MSIPILKVILEIRSTHSSPWTPSCSWQSSPRSPPPSWSLSSCYHFHCTQWSPQKDWRFEFLLLGYSTWKRQDTDGTTCVTHIHLLFRPLPYGCGLKRWNEDLSSCFLVIPLEKGRTKYVTHIYTHLLLRPLPYRCGLKVVCLWLVKPCSAGWPLIGRACLALDHTNPLILSILRRHSIRHQHSKVIKVDP